MQGVTRVPTKSGATETENSVTVLSEGRRKHEFGGFLKMKIKLLGLVLAAAIAATAGAAQAALVLTTTGVDVLPATFDLPDYPVGGTIGTIANPGEGLTLDAPGKVTFEYRGKEALFTNTFRSPTSAVGDQLFSTATSSIGETASLFFGSGLLPFTFTSSGFGGTSISNGSVPSANMSIAFADLKDGSFLIFFNDPGSDRDLDDMVVRVSVSQVPLPAAAWLLISAILGLVSFSRIRRSGTQTA